MAEFKTEVKIGAEIEGLKSGISEAQNAIKGLGESVNSSTGGMSEAADRAGQSFNSLGYAMKTSLVYGGVYEALTAIKSGLSSLTIGALDVASSFEDMQIGMAAVIAASHKNTTAEGESISSAQKYAWAKTQAAEAVDKLRKANLETPATLSQLTEAFQTALAPAQQFGLSMDQTIQYTTSMTQAAFALGVPMNQLQQEMRAVFEGDTSKNSRINSLLQIKTDALEAHKAAGDLFPFLMSKLQDFASAGQDISHSWSGIKSNIEDMFQTVQAEIAKNFLGEFEKQGLSLQNALQDNAKNIGASIGGAFRNIYATGKQVFEAIQVPIKQMWNAIADVINIVLALGQTTNEVGGFKVFILGLSTVASAISIVINGLRQLIDAVGIAALTFEKLFTTGEASDAIKAKQEMLYKHIEVLNQGNKDVVKALAETYGRMDTTAPKEFTATDRKKQSSSIGTPEVKEQEETEKQRKEREKAAKAAEKEAEKVAEKIKEINASTEAFKLDGFQREEARAIETYRKELEVVGKSAEGRKAAENHLSAELDSIQRKREEKEKEETNKKMIHDREAKLVQINMERETALAKLQIQSDNIDSERALKNITEIQSLEDKKKIESQRFDIELQSAKQRVALMEGDEEKVKAAKDRLLLIEQKHATEVNKLNNQMAQSSSATYRSMMASVTDTVGNSIGQIINGTMSVKKAMTSMLNSLLTMFTQFIGKQVAAHLLGEETMTAATMSGNAMRVASNIGAALTSLAVSAAAILQQIWWYAALAAAAAYAAIASIPFVGPFLAPAVAAGALIAVGGFAKSVMSAEGGYDIPNGVNPMTQLHQNEMVLPVEHANTIRNLGANGGGGGHNITINAVDAKGVRDLFMNHGSALMESIKNQGRNFNR